MAAANHWHCGRRYGGVGRALEVRALAGGAPAVHLPEPGAGKARNMMLVCTDPAVDPREFARMEPAGPWAAEMDGRGIRLFGSEGSDVNHRAALPASGLTGGGISLAARPDGSLWPRCDQRDDPSSSYAQPSGRQYHGDGRARCSRSREGDTPLGSRGRTLHLVADCRKARRP
jgi:hypothetical protein